VDLIEPRLLGILTEKAEIKKAVTGTDLQGYVALALSDAEAELENRPPINLFRTTFAVPEEPKEPAEQTVFLFPGAQPSKRLARTSILQPVLQWGASVSGGGKSWTIQTYFIRGSADEGLDIGVYSGKRNVRPGDKLTATIALKEHREIAGRRSYFYTCEFEGIPETLISIDVPEPFVIMLVAIEIYGATSCRSLPASGSIVFNTEIKTELGTLKSSWQASSKNACGLSVNITECSGARDEIAIGFVA
jgi:hypothetical protein